MAITVEQTTQLIQLILNSTLMLAIALAWWAVVWVRQGAIATQLQAHQRRVTQLLEAEVRDADQLAGLRQRRLMLQTCYRLTRHSSFIMQAVLVALVASVFSLALRTLVSINWLIPLALGLFIIGIGGLLLSLGLALIESYQMGLLEETVPSRFRTRRLTKALPPARQTAHRPEVAKVRDRMAS